LVHYPPENVFHTYFIYSVCVLAAYGCGVVPPAVKYFMYSTAMLNVPQNRKFAVE
jgi:hypothetical protein